MSKSYRIAHITDLLAVPIEKRERCVQELLMSLALAELTCGDDLQGMDAFTWTDDDSRDCTLIVNGVHAYTMAVQQESQG